MSLFQIIFKEHFGEERGDTYIPDNPLIEGNCKGEDQATMRLNWNGYSLLLYFEKVCFQWVNFIFNSLVFEPKTNNNSMNNIY